MGKPPETDMEEYGKEKEVTEEAKLPNPSPATTDQLTPETPEHRAEGRGGGGGEGQEGRGGDLPGRPGQ